MHRLGKCTNMSQQIWLIKADCFFAEYQCPKFLFLSVFFLLRFGNIKGVNRIILLFETTTATLCDVSRLVLSPIVNQPVAQQ